MSNAILNLNPSVISLRTTFNSATTGGIRIQCINEAESYFWKQNNLPKPINSIETEQHSVFDQTDQSSNAYLAVETCSSKSLDTPSPNKLNKNIENLSDLMFLMDKDIAKL